MGRQVWVETSTILYEEETNIKRMEAKDRGIEKGAMIMSEGTKEIQHDIETLVDDFRKLWLAMLVKETVDDLSKKMITAPSKEISQLIKPIHGRFKDLWTEIMHENIDVPNAREQYKEMVSTSNKTLSGKYRIVDPADLLKKIEE